MKILPSSAARWIRAKVDNRLFMEITHEERNWRVQPFGSNSTDVGKNCFLFFSSSSESITSRHLLEFVVAWNKKNKYINLLVTTILVRQEENSVIDGTVFISVFLFVFSMAFGIVSYFYFLRKTMCFAVVYQNHIWGFERTHTLQFCFAIMIHRLANARHNYPYLYTYHDLL